MINYVTLLQNEWLTRVLIKLYRLADDSNFKSYYDFTFSKVHSPWIYVSENFMIRWFAPFFWTLSLKLCHDYWNWYWCDRLAAYFTSVFLQKWNFINTFILINMITSLKNICEVIDVTIYCAIPLIILLFMIKTRPRLSKYAMKGM